MFAVKTLLNYTVKKMTKQYISALRTNMSSLEFRLKKIDETRNVILKETKHKDLMSKKHKMHASI